MKLLVCIDLHLCALAYPRSRFLITTIPSNMYVFNQDGINLTLQSAAAIIVESLNKLSTSGVAVRDVQSDEVF